jgi:UDP-glucuronate 4-epimerase
MSILVTGSAGFIGSSLVLKLLERRDTVIGIDNHNNYYDVKLKESRVNRFVTNQKYTHLRIDLTDSNLIEDVFRRYNPKKIVNLAAQAE